MEVILLLFLSLARYASAYGQQVRHSLQLDFTVFRPFFGLASPRYLTHSWTSSGNYDSTHFWHHAKVKVKGQGHKVFFFGCRRNPYFLSSFDRIAFKLGGNISYGQAPS